MKKKSCCYLVFIQIVFLCAFVMPGAKASNYVKIAVISEVPRMSSDREPQKLVDLVINFWKKQLNQVLASKPDLILLTEACDRPTGLSRDEQFVYYNVRKDQVKEYFASVAKENKCYIVFGTKHQAKNGNWLNSSCVLDRNGAEIGSYDKNFPTINEMESGIKASNEAAIINCDFGRIACAICFDLNFPELLAKYQVARPDIILFLRCITEGWCKVTGLIPAGRFLSVRLATEAFHLKYAIHWER